MKRLTLIITFLFITGGTGLQAQPVPPAALAAARSILMNLQSNFPAFLRQVHPKLGMTYHESAKTVNGGRALSRGALEASWKSGKKDIRISNDYAAGDKPEYLTNAARFLRERSQQYPFVRSKDVRYNITGLANSTDLFHKGEPGESLVSFHISDLSNELGWRCLVLRLRKSGEKYLICGFDYLYWTP